MGSFYCFTTKFLTPRFGTSAVVRLGWRDLLSVQISTQDGGVKWDNRYQLRRVSWGPCVRCIVSLSSCLLLHAKVSKRMQKYQCKQKAIVENTNPFNMNVSTEFKFVEPSHIKT